MAKVRRSYTQKKLRSILYESLFNPKEPMGPIKVIVEMDDPQYCETRAIEFIKEAQHTLGFAQDNLNENQMLLYNERIANAISLLGLARLIRKEKS